MIRAVRRSGVSLLSVLCSSLLHSVNSTTLSSFVGRSVCVSTPVGFVVDGGSGTAGGVS